MSLLTDFPQLDAVAIAALIKSGQVTSSEVVSATITQIETLNPPLNAVIIPMFEQALTEAEKPISDAPFAGVPFCSKICKRLFQACQ